MKQLKIIKIINSTFKSKIGITLIVARIVLQSSRLQALYWAKKEDKILDLVKLNKEEKEKLNNKTIYQGLDYLYDNQEKLEDKLFKDYYKDNPPKRVFYDVTSSYVEGKYKDSNIVDYGYNRDKKKGKKQIVIGLLTDGNGHAISTQVYKGNTNDVKTFTNQLDKLKNRFNLENITIVGDGGMIKSDDILKIKTMGYEYITSISKASINKLIKDDTSPMKLSLFDEDLKEIIGDGVRYILRQNPFRKEEIRENRKNKIKRLEDFISKKENYYNTHYKAKQQTLENNISKKIADLKLSKFVSFDIDYIDGSVIDGKDKDSNNNSDSYTNKKVKIKVLATIKIIIDEKAKIEIESLDGCYVIKTSLLEVTKDTKEDVHKAYKTLIKVENAFKTLKTEFLEIRPLYLRNDDKIKGHIFGSMLSYNVVLELRGYVKEVSLDYKTIIRKLKNISTIKNKISKDINKSIDEDIIFETIPKVDDDLNKLFSFMKFKLPHRIDM